MERTPLQKYLDAGNSTESLQEDLGINSYRHPTLPLVGFKYNQIDSPKTNDIVRWSRGTVLRDNSWHLVAQSFVRFFNLGEGSPDDASSFDWSNFRCWTKLDGSLIIMYWWDGQWLANTSGSFGLGPINSHDKRSWQDVVWQVSTLYKSKMDPTLTYVFELCTPWNKVIRYYPDPKLVMLGAFRGSMELDPEEARSMGEQAGAEFVEEHRFSSKKDIESFLADKEQKDSTFEGVVIRDQHGIRYKVKSRTYLSLAHMYGNGELGRPKRILPFVMAGETSEILSYFPELKDEIRNVQDVVDNEYEKLLTVWKDCYQIEDQKEFALEIKPRTKFTGLLFQLRKELGKNQNEEELRNKWKTSCEMIVKLLFK